MRAAAAALGAAILLAAAPVAASDSTLDRCEALGAADYARWGRTARIAIDRDLDRMSVDRYEGKVGGVDIPTVYHGRATVDVGEGPVPMRFICLDAGDPEPGPVFFYLLPATE